MEIKVLTLREKLEKKKEILNRQEDLLILEKERSLALEKYFAKEKAMVAKLSTDLSLDNDSNKRLLKENTLASDYLASLKVTNSECWHFLRCYRVYEDLGNGLRIACWRSLVQSLEMRVPTHPSNCTQGVPLSWYNLFDYRRVRKRTEIPL